MPRRYLKSIWLEKSFFVVSYTSFQGIGDDAFTPPPSYAIFVGSGDSALIPPSYKMLFPPSYANSVDSIGDPPFFMENPGEFNGLGTFDIRFPNEFFINSD